MGNFSKDQISQYFCPAPWLHTHITPQSERRMCGISSEQATWQSRARDVQVIPISNVYAPQTLDQHWNSEKMKDIRRRMFSGEILPECDSCNANVETRSAYRNYFSDNLFSDRIDEILANTDETGFTTLKPVSFDYRISNLCNFKCRMCGEQLSSAWEVEKKMHGLTNKREIWMLDENKPKIEEFQTTVVEEELWSAVREGRLEEIYWVGGEPVISKIHWDIMEYLVQTNQAKNVVVRYNTNLSRTDWKGLNLYQLLPHFKNVTVQASMDGTGDIAEFIRTGLKWNEWLESFKAGLFLREQFGNDAFVLDVTVTLPGLFSMKSLMDLAVELGVTSYVKASFSSSAFVVMNPLVLPRELLDEVLDDLILYEEALNSPLTKNYSDLFKSLKTTPTYQDKYPGQIELTSSGKRYQQKIEQIRPNTKTNMEEILSANPKVLAWWKNL